MGTQTCGGGIKGALALCWGWGCPPPPPAKGGTDPRGFWGPPALGSVNSELQGELIRDTVKDTAPTPSRSSPRTSSPPGTLLQNKSVGQMPFFKLAPLCLVAAHKGPRPSRLPPLNIGFNPSLSTSSSGADMANKAYKTCVGNAIISLCGTVPGYYPVIFLINRMGRKTIQSEAARSPNPHCRVHPAPHWNGTRKICKQQWRG